MANKKKNIIALAVVLIPFYFVALLQKFFVSQDKILVEEYLGIYMLLGIVGIITVLLLNKYVLGYKLTVFKAHETNLITDIAFSLILLGIFYFVKSLEVFTFEFWQFHETDRTALNSLLSNIFDSTLFSILIIGPFSWINELFSALMIAFILINLWELSSVKTWTITSMVFTASIIALLQINNGIPSVISSFIVIVVFNYIFHRYRSIFPLFFASVLYQTIDLVSYWIYM
jgi:hypothetical protein